MAKAKNRVISGDYDGSAITSTLGTVSIITGLFKTVGLNKETVERYELVTDEQRKSMSSGIARGMVGGLFLGPLGVAAGLTAKSKGIYQVVIVFKDGKKSLIEVNDKIYKALTTCCFNFDEV